MKHKETHRNTQDILNTQVEEILSAGARRQAALSLAQVALSEAQIRAWLEDFNTRLEHIQRCPEQNLGFIEEAIAQASREPLRLMAQAAAQAKSNATPCQCHRCQTALTDVKVLRRTIASRFGLLEIWRKYGRCEQCEQTDFPADHALGLAQNAPASPYLQEIAALLTTKMPPEQAVPVAQRLGLDLSRCFLHREARRQGLKAQAVLAASLAELDSWEGIQGVAREGKGPAKVEPSSLVIEIDAWNIRERDHWGQTEAMRKKDPSWSRWHWVYMGTVFRLDHRSQTAGGRPIISQRGYASTRQGVDALMRQLHRQAIDCGLWQAQHVLVIADGALWIWNAAKDRFAGASCRLDLYHAQEHLWAVANECYGKGTPEARAWVEPVLKQLKRDDHPGLIESLQELAEGLKSSLGEKVQKQIDYFENNKNRMSYRAILRARRAVEIGKATEEQKAKASEPLGSGAVESTCRQYQCRFKRTGQFWTMTGDEALMCLETFWRNDRWHHLYPHAKPPSFSQN